jgi:hypothetical protein
MRTLLVSTLALMITACASQAPTPEKSAAAPAAAPAAKPGPQCYSGDHERFFNVEEKTTIAGVAVTCKASADGKAGQWVGAKH